MTSAIYAFGDSSYLVEGEIVDLKDPKYNFCRDLIKAPKPGKSWMIIPNEDLIRSLSFISQNNITFKRLLESIVENS